jgi:hypothetical protein
MSYNEEVTQVVECLLCQHEPLSSNPSLTKKRKKNVTYKMVWLTFGKGHCDFVSIVHFFNVILCFYVNYPFMTISFYQGPQ